MCCSVNGYVCLVCYVFVNYLVKQFAVVIILLLNVVACPLTDLAGLLFLNQQVKEPTCKLNIIDLIFCPDELVNSSTNSDKFLSDVLSMLILV